MPYIISTKEEFRNIYTVFAGGDDLFLIGPWNKIISFATFLNESFNKYVCGNKDITISTGISVNKPGEPVRHLYRNSETALKKSKKEKDSVTLFSETVKWTDFEKLLQIKEGIEKWYKAGIINNAMLFRFNDLIEMIKQEQTVIQTKKNISMEDLNCFKWRAMFKYTVARNTGKGLKGDEKIKAIEEVEKAGKWFGEYGSSMRIPLWQIIYNERKGG